MKRFIVIGCPGAGKSVFSERMAAVTGLPLWHMDSLYWREDRTHLEREELLEILHEITAQEAWILDGNYSGTMEYRLRKCDCVIFLDYPTDVCLEGLKDRIGKKRPDMPWVEHGEGELYDDLLAFVSGFAQEQRPKILDLLDRYSRKEIITLHSRREADELLDYWEKMKGQVRGTEATGSEDA